MGAGQWGEGAHGAGWGLGGGRGHRGAWMREAGGEGEGTRGAWMGAGRWGKAQEEGVRVHTTLGGGRGRCVA